MAKKAFKPGTMLAPVPAVMVSCDDNIFTAAWTGIVNSEPPMTYVSIRKERFSHGLIADSGEFVINLVNKELTFATDWCGVKSGRDFDKWKECSLTRQASEVVGCPQIAESPVSLECKVTEIKELGSHDMFLAEIVSISVDEKLLDDKGGIHLERAGLTAYSHGHYYALQREEIGRFGYSVMKPKTRKRYEAQKRAARRAGSRNKARNKR